MIAIILGVLMFFSYSVYAENIDPLNDGSQYAYGENIGWLNFEPSLGPGITVTTSELTGYVWAENISWINLSPASFGGVINTGNGHLAGYAWGENVGWISFSCENTGSCATVDYKVVLDAQGDFNGWAWGENIGWIHFKSLSPVAYKVQTDGATLITLTSFTAEPGNNQVILIWTTESEIDNAGFNIYRAEAGNGEYVKINDSLIPAEGSSTQGATYQFIDEDVRNRITYYYKLEDIDLNGNSTMHGPVSAMPRRVNVNR
jgi:hypothetical protein